MYLIDSSIYKIITPGLPGVMIIKILFYLISGLSHARESGIIITERLYPIWPE